MVYYNEFDTKAAATLRELIKCNLIAPGDVDERSIEDVLPNELTGYTQCHFFAGYGIWSYALRQAGWPDSREVWTGSCPCQPFSAAGKGAGFDDERHLWPAFFHLIQHGKRSDIPLYGEQVASPDALAWLDVVCADMEAANHPVRTFDLCAAGFGAPIIRQRLFWLAGSKHSQRRSQHSEYAEAYGRNGLGRGCNLSGLAGSEHDGSYRPSRLAAVTGSDGTDGRILDGSSSVGGPGSSIISGLEGLAAHGDGADGRTEPLGSATETSESCGMGSAKRSRSQCVWEQRSSSVFRQMDGAAESRNTISASGAISMPPIAGRPGPTNGFWGTPDWLFCRDDKWRPVESGTFPLAHGYPERVGILRGAGNAINAEVAKAFIEATKDFV